MASNSIGSTDLVSSTIIAGNWCYTSFKTFEYTWTIADFRPYTSKESNFMTSPIFKDNEQNTKWRLELGFNRSRGPLSLTLASTSDDGSDLRAVFNARVLNGQNGEIGTVESGRPHSFKRNNFCTAEGTIDANSIYNSFGSMLHGNAVSIVCKIALLDSNVVITPKSRISRMEDREFLLATDLSKLLDNGKFSDITLVADDREFRSHKAVLSARSDVFAAMFEHQMEENTKKRVVITDIKPDVLEEMLRFIYTSQSANIKEMAKELLIAADKYALTQLVQMCEDELLCGINIESAAEILTLADLSNAVHLKAQLIEFINMNGNEVTKTDGWKNLIKTNAELLAEIYEAIFRDGNI